VIIGLFKYLFVAFVAMMIYLVYLGLIKPYLYIQKYRKYKNVYVNPIFTPLIGDLQEVVDNTKDGKVHYASYWTNPDKFKGCDLWAKLEGIRPTIHVVSGKAVEEFVRLVPSKIDRSLTVKGLPKMMENSFMNFQTDKEIKDRRKQFTKMFNLNSSSKYIPRMVECAKNILDEMAGEDHSDILFKMN
jgi:hypothetical protein